MLKLIEAEYNTIQDVKGAKIHYGFNQAYEDIATETKTAMENYLAEFETASIFITGHSLGAALATVAILDIIRSLNIDNRRLNFYTYGSPRVGNSILSDYLTTILSDKQYNRVTHYDDVVPHLVPSVTGYKHAGNEIWCINKTYDSIYKECSNQINQVESKECSNSLLLKKGIQAHLNYLGMPISNMCNNYTTTCSSR